MDRLAYESVIVLPRILRAVEHFICRAGLLLIPHLFLPICRLCMTSLKTDGSKEWKKIKFCNFEGILRQTRWPVGVDALHSIPISKREEKLASS